MDISEKKQIEHERQQAAVALQNSQARFRRITENVLGMICRYVLHADGREKFTYVSSQVRELHEVELELVRQEPARLWERVHADDVHRLREDIKLSTETLESIRSEYRLSLPKKGIRWVQLFAQPERLENGDTAWDGVVIDISDRKRTESALQLSEARAQATFTQATVGFIELDLKTKTCVRANDCFCKMVGYTSAELAEMTLRDVTYPDDLPTSVKFLKQLLKGEIDSINLEKRYVRKDGTLFWAETTAYLIKPEGGEAIYSVGLIQDISEKKRLEAERQRATVALQNSQARFRRITENIPGMIFRYVLHVDGSDELTYVNAQIRELFEIEPESAVQEVARLWQRIHPDDVPRLKDALQISAKALEPLRSEHRLNLPKKGLRWVQLFAQPERLECGNVAWDGVVVDVSDRKAAEQALVLKQHHLEALLNNIPHIAWIKDSDSQFIAVNEPLAQSLNCSAADMVGKTDYDYLPAELARAYREEDGQVLASGQRKVVEERVQWGDGRWGWLETTKTPFWDAQGQFAGTVGISADITARKQAERLLADYNCELERQVEERTQALQESEERLRLALSATQQGFFDVNLQTGEAIVSPDYALMLGYDPATFCETDVTWRSRVHPDDLEQAHQAYRAYEAGQAPQYKTEFRLKTQQGNWKWILSVGQFVEWDETGRPTRLLGTHTDISDRKFAEIQLATQNALLAKIAQGQPLSEVLHALIHTVERDLNGALCSVLLLDKNNRLRHGAAPSLPAAFNQAADNLLIGEREGSCGTAAFRTQTVIVADIATDPLWERYKDLALKHGLKACWSSPITARGGDVLGTFAMYYKQVRSPQTHELRVIKQMAHIAGIAIERQQADTRLRQSEATLLKAQQVAHVGNWEFDIASQTITWSPEMFRIYGLDPAAAAP
ncbi:MAG: PAS domain-containing protein, partial [Phormidesmis sp.]